ncbi:MULTISPECIES: NUDIX hydrolase [Caloramator]|uniref:ADP-ribose pyrophosphatase n=1 Tax=Caloramator proteoclasticus DSM 10124 TaxID=1121262 RepID=A0A1M4Y6A1_9CLOT|nr:MULTISPECIES: NUDIX hydrolase [Caloramator]SHF01291.1 ADP-ribose pyrophosphatase [Caloramator proteoclasticus DSM 10124]
MFKEKTLKSNYLFKGKVINLRIDEVETYSNRISTREIVEHNGGVGIVAVEDGNVFLVRQYRRPFDEIIYEIPAGKLEMGEEPLSCAYRELEEETGYKALDMKLMTSIYTSPGFCTEKLYIYFCDKMVKTKTNFDEDEYLELIKVPILEAKKMILDGTIKDAKSIVGILMLNDFIHK